MSLVSFRFSFNGFFLSFFSFFSFFLGFSLDLGAGVTVAFFGVDVTTLLVVFRAALPNRGFLGGSMGSGTFARLAAVVLCCTISGASTSRFFLFLFPLFLPLSCFDLSIPPSRVGLDAFFAFYFLRFDSLGGFEGAIVEVSQVNPRIKHASVLSLQRKFSLDGQGRYLGVQFLAQRSVVDA